MKIITQFSKSLWLLGFLFVFAGTSYAQSSLVRYEGYAWVAVKNAEGHTRVINVIGSTGNYSSEASFKKKMDIAISREKRDDEEYDSPIKYKIFEDAFYDDRGGSVYEGSASVKVFDKKTGKTRFINTSSTSHYAIGNIMTNLLLKLNSEKNYSEDFITPVSYDINRI